MSLGTDFFFFFKKKREEDGKAHRTQHASLLMDFSSDDDDKVFWSEVDGRVKLGFYLDKFRMLVLVSYIAGKYSCLSDSELRALHSFICIKWRAERLN